MYDEEINPIYENTFPQLTLCTKFKHTLVYFTMFLVMLNNAINLSIFAFSDNFFQTKNISSDEWTLVTKALSEKLATKYSDGTEEKIKHVSDLMENGFGQKMT